MKLETYLTPHSPENEEIFGGSLIVMIDVLRASTTICVALHNGARELIPTDSLDKAVSIYSGLSRSSRFIGGERGGVKPSGFDAGNSPLEYTSEKVGERTVIFTTTNGTRIFQKAKLAKCRIVAGFVNVAAVNDFIISRIANDDIDNVCIFCAGNSGRFSYEDTLCAGKIISDLANRSNFELSDSSIASKDLYEMHKNSMNEFIKKCEHGNKLIELGFENDIDIALSCDTYPVVPVVSGSSIKKI